jgi:hypothetical protein
MKHIWTFLLCLLCLTARATVYTAPSGAWDAVSNTFWANNPGPNDVVVVPANVTNITWTHALILTNGGTIYVIGADFTSGADVFYADGPATVTSVASLTQAAYSFSASAPISWNTSASTEMYGFVNFTY